MTTRVGAGLATEDGGVDAFAEAAARAASALGGASCDLALVFAGESNLECAAEGMAAVGERLRPAALAGCGAQGVVAGAREVERGGVAVWAASLPDAEVEPFELEALVSDEGVAIAGVPELGDASAALLLANPYRFPVEGLLEHVSEAQPGLPVVGGLASAGPGPATLLGPDGPAAAGAVGVVLRGADVRACVSQGARPIGPEMTVTAGEGNVIEELASQPAVERIREAVSELDPSEQALAAAGLLLGVVVEPNKPDYERGDFLIRGIAGVDERLGAITVGARVTVGQTVRMQVRDAGSAHEDLELALDRELAALGGPPAGALLFTCNGRGSRMFRAPHHDARAVSEAFGGAPTGGFFCAGEIGPVGPRSFVHGFTATLAVFPA